MAQVRGGGAACSAAPPGRFSAGSNLGCQQQQRQLWRPAKEVLQFLTECALPPPPLAITMGSSDDTSHAKPDAFAAADADAPVNAKRPPPARWEPPAQMKIMRAAASSSCSSEGVTSDQLAPGASGICNESLNEKAAGNGTVQTESINSQDFSPKPSVGSNSYCGKSDNFMQAAASSDCSPRAPGQATIDIWQFPRPSKTPSPKTISSGQSTQQLPPPHRTCGQSKIPGEERLTTKGTFSAGEIKRHLSWDRNPVTSRTSPKNTNAFARAACNQSTGWAPQPTLQRTVGLSPVNMKASGYETCVAQNNSFGAFASVGRDEIFNKEAPQVFSTTQKSMESLKSDNAGNPSMIDVNVSNSFAALQENITKPQIEGSTAIQVEVTNAVSENDQPAALDLLVNAVQVASGTSSVAGDKAVNCDKEAGAENRVSDNSTKVENLSYFVHGRIPFKQKRITRRAKSAYQKSQNAHKDNVATNPVPNAIPPCPQGCVQANLEGNAQEQANSFQKPESPNLMHGREKNEKQIHQQHKSLEAILFGYDSPIVQLRRGRTKILPSRYDDTMINTATKRSRSRNFRRNSDIWR
ncbi:hypothetical protein O6H91_20G042800 [Diphasiastrum complanatum]|nr:hypothetical protein O6H91_20G042800 [Diphasiastrum complanatum]